MRSNPSTARSGTQTEVFLLPANPFQIILAPWQRGIEKHLLQHRMFHDSWSFTFGNESRTDNALRQPGIANFDFSVFKKIPLEKVVFDFRVEAFNLFNRVQFGAPVTTAGSSTEGWITSVYNNPRLPQVSGRITF